MASNYQLFWTDEAISNLDSILLYLEKNWTQKEILNFKKKLGQQLKLIENNPLLFPISEFCPTMRKAVLSKQTILFYELKETTIFLVYLFNTNQNQSRIKPLSM